MPLQEFGVAVGSRVSAHCNAYTGGCDSLASGLSGVLGGFNFQASRDITGGAKQFNSLVIRAGGSGASKKARESFMKAVNSTCSGYCGSADDAGVALAGLTAKSYEDILTLFRGIRNDYDHLVFTLKIMDDLRKANRLKEPVSSQVLQKAQEYAARLYPVIHDKTAPYLQDIIAAIGKSSDPKQITTMVQELERYIAEGTDLSDLKAFVKTLIGTGVLLSAQSQLQDVRMTMEQVLSHANRDELRAALDKVYEEQMGSMSADDKAKFLEARTKLIDSFDDLKRGSFEHDESIIHTYAEPPRTIEEDAQDKLDRKIRGRKAVKKQEVVIFDRALDGSRKAMADAIIALAASASRQALVQTDAFDRLITALQDVATDIMDKRNVKVVEYLAGYGDDYNVQVRRREYMDKFKNLIYLCEQVQREPQYSVLAGDLSAIIAAVRSFVAVCDKWFEEISGGDDRADCSRFAEQFDISVYTGGSQSIYTNLGELDKAFKRLKSAVRFNDIRARISTSSADMEAFAKDHERITGEAIARRIEEIKLSYALTRDQMKQSKTFIRNESESRGVDANKRTLYLELLDREESARIGLYKALESLEHYLKHFTIESVGGLKEIGAIKDILDGVEVIADWYDEEAVKELKCAVIAASKNVDHTINEDADNIDDSDTLVISAAIVDDGRVKDNTEQCRMYVERAVSRVEALQNIFAIFAKLGAKQPSFAEKAKSLGIMTPIQMYKAVTTFIKCCSTSLYYDNNGELKSRMLLVNEKQNSFFAMFERELSRKVFTGGAASSEDLEDLSLQIRSNGKSVAEYYEYIRKFCNPTVMRINYLCHADELIHRILQNYYSLYFAAATQVGIQNINEIPNVENYNSLKQAISRAAAGAGAFQNAYNMVGAAAGFANGFVDTLDAFQNNQFVKDLMNISRNGGDIKGFCLKYYDTKFIKFLFSSDALVVNNNSLLLEMTGVAAARGNIYNRGVNAPFNRTYINVFYDLNENLYNKMSQFYEIYIEQLTTALAARAYNPPGVPPPGNQDRIDAFQAVIHNALGLNRPEDIALVNRLIDSMDVNNAQLNHDTSHINPASKRQLQNRSLQAGLSALIGALPAANAGDYKDTKSMILGLANFLRLTDNNLLRTVTSFAVQRLGANLPAKAHADEWKLEMSLAHVDNYHIQAAAVAFANTPADYTAVPNGAGNDSDDAYISNIKKPISAAVTLSNTVSLTLNQQETVRGSISDYITTRIQHLSKIKDDDYVAEAIISASLSDVWNAAAAFDPAAVGAAPFGKFIPSPIGNDFNTLMKQIVKRIVAWGNEYTVAVDNPDNDAAPAGGAVAGTTIVAVGSITKTEAQLIYYVLRYAIHGLDYDPLNPQVDVEAIAAAAAGRQNPDQDKIKAALPQSLISKLSTRSDELKMLQESKYSFAGKYEYCFQVDEKRWTVAAAGVAAAHPAQAIVAALTPDKQSQLVAGISYKLDANNQKKIDYNKASEEVMYTNYLTTAAYIIANNAERPGKWVELISERVKGKVYQKTAAAAIPLLTNDAENAVVVPQLVEMMSKHFKTVDTATVAVDSKKFDDIAKFVLRSVPELHQRRFADILRKQRKTIEGQLNSLTGQTKRAATKKIADIFYQIYTEVVGDMPTIPEDFHLLSVFIKALAAKAMTIIGAYELYTLDTGKAKTHSLNPLRVVLGAGDESIPQIIEAALPLYVRIMYMIEFYKELFDFASHGPEAERMFTIIPDVDGVFGKLIDLVFNKNERIINNTPGVYGDYELSIIVREVNAIYQKFSSAADPLLAAVHALIAEMNRRYGMFTRTYSDTYRKEFIERPDITPGAQDHRSYRESKGYNILGEDDGIVPAGPSAQYADKARMAIMPDIPVARKPHPAVLHEISRTHEKMLQRFQFYLAGFINDREDKDTKPLRKALEYLKTQMQTKSSPSARMSLLRQFFNSTETTYRGSDNTNFLVAYQEFVTLGINTIALMYQYFHDFDAKLATGAAGVNVAERLKIIMDLCSSPHSPFDVEFSGNDVSIHISRFRDQLQAFITTVRDIYMLFRPFLKNRKGYEAFIETMEGDVEHSLPFYEKKLLFELFNHRHADNLYNKCNDYLKNMSGMNGVVNDSVLNTPIIPGAASVGLINIANKSIVNLVGEFSNITGKNEKMFSSTVAYFVPRMYTLTEPMANFGTSSLAVQFNKALFSYVINFFDDRKIYYPLVENLVNGSDIRHAIQSKTGVPDFDVGALRIQPLVSYKVMSDAITTPVGPAPGAVPALPVIVALAGDNLPSTKKPITLSLALMLHHINKERDSQTGQLYYAERSLSEINEVMRDRYYTMLPVYKVIFQSIHQRAKMFRQISRKRGNLSEVDELLEVYLNTTEVLIRSIDSVLAEVSRGKPQYLEFEEGSLKRYESSNGTPALTPISASFPAYDAGETVIAMLNGDSHGSDSYRYIRGMLPILNGCTELGSYAGMQKIVDDYNANPETERLSQDKYELFMKGYIPIASYFMTNIFATTIGTRLIPGANNMLWSSVGSNPEKIRKIVSYTYRGDKLQELASTATSTTLAHIGTGVNARSLRDAIANLKNYMLDPEFAREARDTIISLFGGQNPIKPINTYTSELLNAIRVAANYGAIQNSMNPFEFDWDKIMSFLPTFTSKLTGLVGADVSNRNVGIVDNADTSVQNFILTIRASVSNDANIPRQENINMKKNLDKLLSMIAFKHLIWNIAKYVKDSLPVTTNVADVVTAIEAKYAELGINHVIGVDFHGLRGAYNGALLDAIQPLVNAIDFNKIGHAFYVAEPTKPDEKITSSDRIKQNMFELNVMPLNIHKMMSQIALAELYIYANTYDAMIAELHHFSIINYASGYRLNDNVDNTLYKQASSIYWGDLQKYRIDARSEKDGYKRSINIGTFVLMRHPYEYVHDLSTGLQQDIPGFGDQNAGAPADTRFNDAIGDQYKQLGLLYNTGYRIGDSLYVDQRTNNDAPAAGYDLDKYNVGEDFKKIRYLREASASVFDKKHGFDSYLGRTMMFVVLTQHNLRHKLHEALLKETDTIARSHGIIRRGLTIAEL